MGRPAERLVEVGYRRAGLQPDDFRAGDHYFVHPPAVEAEDTRQQLRLVLAYSAFLGADADQHAELCLGDGGGSLLLLAEEEACEEVRRGGEENGHRSHHDRQQFGRPRHEKGHAVGGSGGQHFRCHFAEERDGGGDGDRGEKKAPAAGQVHRQQPRHAGGDDDEEVLQHDDRGEEAVVSIADPLPCPGALAPLLGEVSYADAVRADDGDLDEVHQGVADDADDQEREAPG